MDASLGCGEISPSFSPHSVVSVNSSFTDWSEPEEDLSNKLLVLDSLFPLVKCLPGFTQQQSSGFYYVQGTIDQESLYDYTKRIGRLTLGAEADSDSRLAMHVLVRIARLQDPNKPLFPSLHHLDIPYYSSVLSFLESAIDQAPHLSTLILGPGRIQDEILHLTSKYKHLRCLELRNVGISLTDQLLQDLGSLQYLETFIFQDSGTSTYKPSSEIPIPTIRQQDPEAWEASYVPSRGLSRISYVTDEMPKKCPGALFPSGYSGPYTPPGPRQQELEAESVAYGPFPVSCNPCRELSPESRISHAMETSPQIHSVRSLSPGPTVSHGNDTAVVDAEVNGASLFPALRTFEAAGSFSLIETLVNKVRQSHLQVLSIQLLEFKPAKQFSGPILSTSSRKKKSKVTSTVGMSSPPKRISAPHIVSFLRRSIQGGNSLISVSLKNDQIQTFSLPSDLFEMLLLRPDMKHLEITGIDIDSTDIKLHRLEAVVDSKLEVLHLPIHSTAASTAFVELRYIAENCPHLKSLRCRLSGFGEIPVSIPKSHGLEVLSVSNAEVRLEQQELFKIARYLDSAFPNLKTIQTHDENENNAEQWVLISELVKTVCQAVRRDERARHGT